MSLRMAYAIKYVADMDRAVAFYRDTLGLDLKFATPGWSEFATGTTTLALHPATPGHLAGTTVVGFRDDDFQAFCDAKAAAGVTFTKTPHEEHGVHLTEFLDSDGAPVSFSG
jgi:catechol 2,3-dioxygenase-like lactoylglutathione lyase family enzyme